MNNRKPPTPPKGNQYAAKPDAPPTTGTRVPVPLLDEIRKIAKAEKKSGHGSTVLSVISEVLEIGLKNYPKKD